MKKGGLVLILFLAVIFIAGCSRQGAQQEIQEVDPFAQWTYSPPTYYYTIDETYIDQINQAIKSNNQEDCNKIKDGGISRESVMGTVECRFLLTKISAFMEKDYSICNELNSADNPEEYEECIAPIVAYSAISLQDPEYCQKYLNNERLIKICEKDYEIYS